MPELDELYEHVILDHYRNPHCSEPLPTYTVEVTLENPFCGDQIAIHANNKDARLQLSIQSEGCAISQASGSLMGLLVNGLSTTESRATTERLRRLLKGGELSDHELDSLGDANALIGVRKFPIRIKCALLAWNALEDVLKQLESSP